MAETGLITRAPRGWVFFRLADAGSEAALASAIVASLDAADPCSPATVRASAVKRARRTRRKATSGACRRVG
jgi:hypothetical protein